MKKKYSTEDIERIALAHFKKHREYAHIKHMTYQDVLANFQNSFKFIMNDKRFDIFFDMKSRKDFYGEDPEFNAYWKAKSVAMRMVEENVELVLIHCPIMGSQYMIRPIECE